MEVIDLYKHNEEFSIYLKNLSIKTLESGGPLKDYTKIFYEIVDSANTFESLRTYYKEIIISSVDYYDIPKERFFFDNSYLDKFNLSIQDFHIKSENLFDYYIKSKRNIYVESILEGKFDLYILDENISLDENKNRFKQLLKSLQKYISKKHETIIKNISNILFDARILIRTFSSKTLFRRSDEDHSLLAIIKLNFTNYLLTKKESYEKTHYRANRSYIIT